MLSALVKLVPIALAGAFLPTWTSHVLLLLGTKRPLATSWAFIAGNATYRLLLGLTALFVFSATSVRGFIDRLPVPGPAAQVLLGIALIGLGLVVGRSRVDPDADELPGWLRSFEKLPPWLTFSWGFLSVASPGIQYLYFLGGVAVISNSGVPAVEQVVLLVAFVALLQVMLAAPPTAYALRRDRADQTLTRIKRWTATSGARVFSWLLIGFGIAAICLAAYSALASR